MTTRRSTLLVAGLAVVVLLLAGCGDDEGGDDDAGGGRPTTDDLIAVLPNNGLDAQGKECLAQAFVDSEVSDAGLQAIVDGGGLAGARGVSQVDQDAVQDAMGEGIACSIKDDLPSVTATTAADGSSTEPGSGPGSTEVPPTEAPTTAAPTTAAG